MQECEESVAGVESCWCGTGVGQSPEDCFLGGEIDFEELFADATFIRAKKGVPRLAIPRLARV